MRNRFFSILLLICVFGIAIVMMSCVNDYKARGGGWFTYDPEDGFPTSKVTFGFQFDCTDNGNDNNGLGMGQFQYNDHGMGIRFHGVVEALDCNPDLTSPQVAYYAGMVKPQSSREVLYEGEWYKPAYFAIMITDGGTPGPSNGDKIQIALFEEEEWGEEEPEPFYEAEGFVKGGNIKIFLGE
jgi:hypothetical protein